MSELVCPPVCQLLQQIEEKRNMIKSTNDCFTLLNCPSGKKQFCFEMNGIHFSACGNNEQDAVDSITSSSPFVFQKKQGSCEFFTNSNTLHITSTYF